MTAEVLHDAKSNGVACGHRMSVPLQSRCVQGRAKKVSGIDVSMPVIHLPELVAFAFGRYRERFAQLRTRALVLGG